MAILLQATLLLPLAGLALIGRSPARARETALAVSLVVLAMAGYLAARFPVGAAAFAATDIPWLGWQGSLVDIRLSFGLDGLSVWLFALSALLMVVSVLVSWQAIQDQPQKFYRLLLLLEFGLLGVFTARDIILFYVFFEFTLIPLFFLIGIWGSEERRYAAVKFFLYTLAGSMLTFLGLLAIVILHYYARPANGITFSIPALTSSLALRPLDPQWQFWIFLALFAGFAIKVPLFPLHTWLPLAHVQAPTAGSVVLAGLLLKIGVYGFLRFCLPLLPDAVAECAPWLLWLSVIGIVYGALVALAQPDMKRLIAYSSVSHMGFCMLGIFALNRLGIAGGALQMVNHGLSTGGLFAMVGMLYERYHTRQIADLGGLARRTPILAFFMLVLTFSSIGLPGLNGFAGEFLLLLGMFQRAWSGEITAATGQFRWISVLAVAGVVLGAWYMLQLVGRLFFGPLREPSHGQDQPPVRDLCPREILALAPLVALIVWIGVQPRFFLDRMTPALEPLAAVASRAMDHAGREARGVATAPAGQAYSGRTPTCLAVAAPREGMPPPVP
jgi:NADH-quinone oxidoreductase subunit M